MHSIAIDFDMHFEASGPVDIPAGSEVIFGDNGTYIGFVGPDGQEVAHRGFEGAMSAAVAPQPAATPAAAAHADELGVDLSQVEGTGQGGTITKADVAAAAEDTPAA